MHSNRHTPKISVITVTYNAGEVLEDTIQSVISQTYHHVEYILVDGASRDHTMAIANRYRERIHKIISEPDKGLYDAMNKGFHSPREIISASSMQATVSMKMTLCNNGTLDQRKRTAGRAVR